MNAMGIIFANIYDSSLGQLTNKRTMASLPYGGRYRQVDFALSNMSNSGIRNIGIISRHNYQSLMNHIASGEEWDLELGEGGLQYLTPFAISNNASYRGKMEALDTAMDFMEMGHAEYVVLADAGILYNIDLNKVLESHIASGKDITVVAKPGVADGEKQLSLAVKLNTKGEIADLAVDYAADKNYLASMGLFVISRELLMHHVKESVARSQYRFERDFLLKQYTSKNLTVGVYTFNGVVQYNDSPAVYFQSTLALTEEAVRNDLFNPANPIFTKVRDRVPTYYGEEASVKNCVVADGCMLEGSVEHSVLFRRVTIEAGAEVKDCVVMNDAVVGAGAQLYCVVLDKEVVIRPGVRLIGTPENPVILKRGEVV